MGYMLVIGVYLAILIIGGFIMSKKKVKNSEDFVVAGRRLPMIILVGTLLATWCGGGGITGSASLIYNYGPWVGVLHFLGAPIGIILLYFIAGKVRKSEKLTIPEIFEARYGTWARLLSALCIMLAYVGIVATQVKAAGNIVSLTTGMNIGLATLIATVFIILLTVTGGMVTVAYSDAVGALVMVGGFLVAIPILISAAGGWSQMVAAIPEAKKGFGGLNAIQIAGYMIPTISLMLGDQNMMQRFASAKDSSEAKKSNIGMFIAEIIVCTLIILMVTVGIVLIPSIDIPSNVIFVLGMNFLPFILGALVLASCVSFIVTTGDSFLLSTATNLTYDVWARFFKKDATDKQKMFCLRLTVILLGLLAVACSLYFPSIITLQMTAYGMYGAAITPALLFALFSKRVTKAGGIAGIITGASVTLVWNVILSKPMGIESAIIAVPAAIVMIIAVSFFTKNSDRTNDIGVLYNE
ncbi:MAG: sodium:solute symporter family protein [Oscillospiraceae bacterium]